MVMPSSERVDYTLTIKAAQAVEALQNAAQKADTFRQRLELAKAAATKFSAETGVSLRNTAKAFESIDRATSAATGVSRVFGLDAKEGWNQVGQAAEHGSRRTVRSIDAIRVAMGVLVSMFVFRALQAVSDFFRGAIEEAKRFEDSLYRIQTIERQLSKEGIEISVKGLHKGIKDLREVFPMFSNEEITELVGNVAITTKELGYAEDKMLKLAAASLILNLNSTEAETALQTQAKITNSLVSPQAKSVGNLGLAFGKAKIEAKAFEMGILQVGESFKDLTEQEKRDIKFQIVLETAGIDESKDIPDILRLIEEEGGNLEALGEYLDSNSVKLAENRAAWNDLKVAVGQLFLPLIPAVTDVIGALTKSFVMLKGVTVEFLTSLGTMIVVYKAIFSGTIKSVDDLQNAIRIASDSLRTEFVNEFFKEVPEDAPKWFMQVWGNRIKEQAETATSGVMELSDAMDELDLSGFGDEIDDILRDAAQAQEDLDTKLSRKMEDLDQEYIEKAEDAYRDYRRKIEDINAEAERRKEDALRKSREGDLKAERDYQNKLWELRMRYLMDLEDALHARDARQIIRLQKQYAIDKEALLRKKRLDDQTRQEDFQAELEQIELQRQRKLEDAKLEYEQKLADQRKAKQRELEDMNIWYAREQEDLRQNIQRKLEDLIRGWIEEGKITQQGAQAVYDILYSYFGPGGMTDQLYQYMQSQLGAMSVVPGNIPVTNYGMIGTVGTHDTGTSTRSPRSSSNESALPFAEGGTLIAARPMTATFGEVPEVVSFTPLNSPGNNVGRLFGDRSAISNGGILELLLTLSPDLESRIVRKSMDEAANVIVKVNRSRT